MAKYTAHHPAPPNAPGVNWVERKGGLPKPIDAIMRALMAKGWTQQRAVATAVNHVKKVCATGRAFGGKTPVSAEARGVACAAVARWEAMKTATSIRSDQRMAIELARDWDGVMEMAEKNIPAKERKKAASKGQTAYGTSFPIRNRDELRRAIAAFGRAPDDKKAAVKAFILRRAKALGAMDLVPDDWKQTSASSTPDALELARKKKVPSKAVFKALGKKFAPKKKVDPAKTDDHAKAGLHRIGKQGNAYVDAKGQTFKRQKGGGFKQAKLSSSDFESKHPRAAKGATGGGRFVSGGGGKGGGGSKGTSSATVDPSKTSDHRKAGLTRVKGLGAAENPNRYTDAQGTVYHRVGKGKSSRFVKGESVKYALKRMGEKAPPRKKSPDQTTSHVQAGLRRVGTKSNLYVDKQGKPHHRVADGTFKVGAPKKPKGKRGKKTAAAVM